MLERLQLQSPDTDFTRLIAFHATVGIGTDEEIAQQARSLIEEGDDMERDRRFDNIFYQYARSMAASGGVRKRHWITWARVFPVLKITQRLPGDGDGWHYRHRTYRFS